MLSWKAECWMSIQILKGLRRQGIRLKARVLCVWHEAVKQRLTARQQRINLKRRHDQMLRRRVVVAWSWRRELAHINLARSARRAVRLQNWYFRWWGEVVAYRRRAKRMSVLCCQFQSRKGSALAYSSLLGWHALAAGLRVKSRVFAKVTRHWMCFLGAKAFSSWTKAAHDERVSRQVCSRSLRLGSRKLLRGSMLSWRERRGFSSFFRKLMGKCMSRQKTRVLCVWQEAVRFEHFKKKVLISFSNRFACVWLRQVVRGWNRWQRTVRIVKSKFSQLEKRLLGQSVSSWSSTRAFSRDDQRKAHRRANVGQRCVQHRLLRLQRLCIQAWEQTLLAQDTKTSRAHQLDTILLAFQVKVEHAQTAACFLAWARRASLGKMRKKGFKRAKRQWLGYSRRAVLSKCFDFWRDDAESERISRQVYSRSVHIGVRRLLLRIVEIWKATVVVSTEHQKSEQTLFLKVRKIKFRLTARVVSEWRDVFAKRRARIRLQLWMKNHNVQSLKRDTLIAWQESAGSDWKDRHAVLRILLLRKRAFARMFLLEWRWGIDDARSLQSQVRDL